MFGRAIADYAPAVISVLSFFLHVPLLLLVFASDSAPYPSPAKRKKGTLGFLLTNPVPRWRVVAEQVLPFWCR